MDLGGTSLTCIEDKLHVLHRSIGLGSYDFDFESAFACTHPYRVSEPTDTIARMGSIADYEATYAALLDRNIRLIHTPEEYLRATQLPHWYPLLEPLTPRSVWYEAFPTVAEVEQEFGFPVFVKGERQTHSHNRRQSIIETPGQLEMLRSEWSRDPVLAWQRVVVRKLLSLRRVAETSELLMPAAFEFRTFWWRGQCVGAGRYWTAFDYIWTDAERDAALAVASEACRRVGVSFLVVDVAQDDSGRWWVIETNDGQESGYAGVRPRQMWQRVLDLT